MTPEERFEHIERTLADVAESNKAASKRMDRLEADLDRLKERHEALALSMELESKERAKDRADFRSMMAEFREDRMQINRTLQFVITAQERTEAEIQELAKLIRAQIEGRSNGGGPEKRRR